jgi:outer membrane protein OmpA-like peptidoglycan-associated protein
MMTRTHLAAVFALVGSAGMIACGGSKPAVVVAEPPPPPPPVAVVEAPPAPPPPKLAAVCDATLSPDGHLKFPHEVEFDSGKSTLKNTDNTNKILQCLVDFMNNNPMVTSFHMLGYTDSQGDTNMNVQLSEARAKAVVDWMVAHGTDAKRLYAKGFGPKFPVAPNDTPEHMAMNRRVEFHVDEIDGQHATKERVELAMNPPAPAAVAVVAPAAGVTVTAAVPAVGVKVATPGVAVGVAAPSVAVGVSAPSSVTVGASTGGGSAPPAGKKK